MHYILGSWYTPSEIGKRAAIFWTAGSLGTMFSGFLQAAAYTHLSGVHGLAGWRWLFIIDAVITIPIAILGYVFLPDLPHRAKPSWWLKQGDIDLANRRMDRIGRKGTTPWTKAKVIRLFSSWHVYLLPFLYVWWNNAIPQQPMGYYLKSFNAKPPPVPGRSYTVSQINLLPLPGTAIFVVMALIWAWVSDGPLNGRRWPFIYLGAFITVSSRVTIYQRLFYVIHSLLMTRTFQTAISLSLRQMSLYDNIDAHFALYWLYMVGVSNRYTRLCISYWGC